MSSRRFAGLDTLETALGAAQPAKGAPSFEASRIGRGTKPDIRSNPHLFPREKDLAQGAAAPRAEAE